MKCLHSAIPLLILVPMLAWSGDDRLWCGQRLVQVGDPVWEVAERCPEPFWQEAYDRPVAVDRRGRAHGLERVEVWTLNFGPSHFMRRLEFVNGRLSRVRQLGYGVAHEPGSRGCNPNDLGKAGETIAEVFARCGRPSHSYEIPAPPVHGYHGSTRRTGERRIWTYRFGPRQQVRELEFVDGWLQRISVL